MAAWPTVAEVKQSLGITVDTRDDVITAAVGAAIEQVAVDLGYVLIEVTEDSSPGGVFALTAAVDAEAEVAEVEPNYSLRTAALILAVMAVKAPDAPYGVAAVFDMGGLRVAAEHPTYQRMLVGSRFRFGVA